MAQATIVLGLATGGIVAVTRTLVRLAGRREKR
jgi:hypothetical protein